MLDWLLEPFQERFMQCALIGVLLAGINCGLIGSYVVLRRLSFLTSALSHTILPGLVLAVWLGISIILGALAAALCTVAVIAMVWAQNGHIRKDSLIGVVNVGFFAFGIILLQWLGDSRDLNALLLGSILSVDTLSLVGLGIFTLAISGLLILFHKELELVACDPEYAQIIGINPKKMNTLLLVLIAIGVVSGIPIMGALLITALLIVPAATATLFAKTLPQTMLYACGFAELSGILGLYASYYWNLPTGAAIVLTACSTYGLCSLSMKALTRKF